MWEELLVREICYGLAGVIEGVSGVIGKMVDGNVSGLFYHSIFCAHVKPYIVAAGIHVWLCRSQRGCCLTWNPSTCS